MYLFGKNNNHLIKNNYKKTFSLPQKARLISKQISKCACGPDYIICLTKDNNVFCYFQSALYNIDFKSDEKIIDIATEDNLILFITQKGQLYASQFIPETVLNDSIKPKLIRLNLSFAGLREKLIKKVTIIKEHIFLKMQNNLIVYITKNDWMQTKTFSDPQIVFASKNNNIMDIAFSQKTYIFLTEEGQLQITSPKDLSSNSIKIQMKQSLKRIASNNVEILGINNEGSIVKIHFKNGKAKLQKMFKISVPFVDLVMNSQNCYAISQDNEAWGWGKNANGQLGLSDYEPRNSAYPLVTLEKFYITKICIGQNYACCLVDQLKQRQSVKISQRSSIGNSIFEVQRLFKKNQQNQSSHRDSFNQTEEFLMPIRYTDQESKVSSSNNDLNSSIEEKNIIVNKKQNYQKTNAFQKGNKSNRKQNNQGQKSSTRNERVSCKSNVSVSRSKCKSQVGVSQPKETPKSINRSKSPFQKQKPKQTKNYPTKIYHSTCSDVMKSSTKSEKKSHAIVSYKTPNKQLEERQTLMLKQRQAEKQNQIRRLKKLLQQREIQESESLKKITDAYKIEKQAYQREKQSYLIEKQSYQIEKQRLLQKIKDLEFHLRHKSDQNKDLFELITHKNLTIEDITSKIQLLQEAIQQHQRTLTARDNEAQEAFLRQKQYQLHINKLQTQIQKMMQVLNYNQRKSQTQIYKKEMERLSTQIKDRIQGQKEYYQDRIKSFERKFQEEKNVYENEIRKLRDQIAYYKKKETEVLNRMKNQNTDNAIRQPLTPYLQNNSQNFMESPSFHTLDIKKGVNKKAGEIQHPNQSIVTLNDECDQNEKFVLKESNRQDIYKSPFSKQSQEVKTRKNSRIYNQSEQYQNQNNFSRQKQQIQVKQILDRIQKNKTYISKSANKLLNLLENDK